MFFFLQDQKVITKKSIKTWNDNIAELFNNKSVKSDLEHLFNYETNIGTIKQLLFELISKLNEKKSILNRDDMTNVIEQYENDNKILLLVNLSVLELCLIISIKHHCEIYDRDPFNFEIILTRFNKFAITTRTFQNLSRDVIMKAFERIQVTIFF